MGKNFCPIVVVDFEYGCDDGGLPNIVCMVAHELDEHLQFVRAHRLWRGEFGPCPPFDIGPDTLIVAYSAQAELMCFQQLGWRFPVNVFDQHTAYLAASNLELPYEPDKEKRAARNKLLGGKGLEDACKAYGLVGWAGINKDAIRTSIGNGTWRGRYSPQEILDYCNEDCRMEAALLRLQLRPHGSLPAADVPRQLVWSQYSAKAVARVQTKAMPFDVPLYNLLQKNQLAVIDALRQQYDPSYRDADPIWTPEGKFSEARFKRWLLSVGIHYWPHLESGRLNLEGDTFLDMAHLHPGLMGIYTLREAISFINRGVPIGRDDRQRPSLFPFGAKTGRNRHSKSIYNTHAGLRSLLLFPEGKVGAYLDFKTQEVGIAAVQSQDQAMLAAYRTGDVYYGFARDCKLTADPDRAHWKKHNQDQRQQMKQLVLGINYGRGTQSIANTLGVHVQTAVAILDRHQQAYPRFYEWRESAADAAIVNRFITTKYGWTMWLGPDVNRRTLYNYKVQGGGAEMTQIATVRLCEAGIVPCMIIHDALLLEEDNIEQIMHAKEIMMAVGREVCDGLEIGVDGDGADELLMNDRRRYADKRPDAVRLWDVVMRTLKEILNRTRPGRARA